MILGITGHRPQRIGGYDPLSPRRLKLYAALMDKIVALNPKQIVTGMALGVDQDAAQIAMTLNIPFVAIVPFVGQEKKWNAADQKAYHLLLSKAQRTIIAFDGGFASWKLNARNHLIVDASDEMLAVFDGSPSGGTKNCIDYAKQKSKKITFINPLEL